jgi:hypothetical protein
MHSRAMGGGRRLALLGALLVIVSVVLPWFAIGGGAGQIPERVVHAWQDIPGLAVFLAGLGTLALLALPYAMSPRPAAVDRGIVFGLLAIVAIAGVAAWAFGYVSIPEGLLPTRAPGLWIAAVGAIALGRAAFEISRELPRR